jgi:hypothetical protein
VPAVVSERTGGPWRWMARNIPKSLKGNARWRGPAGVSLLEGCCSIHLSYGRRMLAREKLDTRRAT